MERKNNFVKQQVRLAERRLKSVLKEMKGKKT